MEENEEEGGGENSLPEPVRNKERSLGLCLSKKMILYWTGPVRSVYLCVSPYALVVICAYACLCICVYVIV